MTILRDDSFVLTRRGGGTRSIPQFRVLLAALLFVSVALLVLSRLNHSAVQHARAVAIEQIAPVLDGLAAPLAPVRWVSNRVRQAQTMSDEVAALRRENQRLKAWQWRAQDLERRLDALRQTTNAVTSPALDILTARVIAQSTGPFVRSVMINAGAGVQVRNGYPVVNGEGLVGRIVTSGQSVARVLLATDINSRVPVRIGSAGVRAIMVGDNGAWPALQYVPDGAVIKSGDVIATSGVGGLYPRGLRVGRVMRRGGALRVKLDADFDQLDYVSVLFHRSPARRLTDDVAPATAALPPGRAARRAIAPE